MNYEYCDGFTHTIKKGDTLYEISRKHNVPLALLLRANPYVDVFNLQVGDTICIPSGNNQTVPYPVNTRPQNDDKTGCENCRKVMETVAPEPMVENNVDMSDQMSTEADDREEKTWIKYVVKPGDTMEDILARMTGSIDEFVDKNGLSSIYMLPGIAYYICKEKK